MKNLLILILIIALAATIFISSVKYQVNEDIWSGRMDTKVYQVNDLIHALEDCQNERSCEMPVLIKEN